MIITTEGLTKSGRLELTATGDVDIQALADALRKGCDASLGTRTAPELDEDEKPTGAMLPTIYKVRCADHAAAKAIFEAHTGEPLPVDPIEAEGKDVRIKDYGGKVYLMRESGPEEIDASALAPK